MATIDELMKGRQPGEIRIQAIGEDSDWWFRPYYKVDLNWFGESESDPVQDFSDSENDWQLFKEPKKKVKRWLWAYKEIGCWKVTKEFHTAEEAVKRLKIADKLEWSETEFEED